MPYFANRCVGCAKRGKLQRDELSNGNRWKYGKGISVPLLSIELVFWFEMLFFERRSLFNAERQRQKAIIRPHVELYIAPRCRLLSRAGGRISNNPDGHRMIAAMGHA